MDHDPGEALAPGRVVWLDAAVFADIREMLTSTLGTLGSAFVLIDLDDGGLRGAAVDAQTGQCLIELNDNTLHSASFDRAMADHLVRTGKTAVPATTEWARELVGLMAQARMLLGNSEAVFVMGEQDVGLLRVNRADVEEALNPSAVRATSVARSVSLASPIPISAVVVMSQHVEWPGLLAELSQAFDGQVPVLPMLTTPEPAREGKHSHSAAQRDVAPVSVPPATVVPPTTAVTAPSPVYVPKTRSEPTPMPVRSTEPVATADPLPDPLPEPFPGPVTEPAPVFDVRAAERRRKQNRLVMAGAATIAAVIVAGGIIAAVGPWREDTTGLESQRYLTPPATSESTTTTTKAPAATSTKPSTPSSTSVVPPIDTSAALAPIVVYTAPAPPPPPPTTRRATPPRPRQNTIPNPIPGQPPIVLP